MSAYRHLLQALDGHAAAATMKERGTLTIILVTIYMPQDNTSASLRVLGGLRTLLERLTTAYPNIPVVVGGDWNCCENSTPGSPTSLTNTAKELAQIMTDFQLVDVHLEREPKTTMITNAHPTTSRRLDRLYAPVSTRYRCDGVHRTAERGPSTHYGISFIFRDHDVPNLPASQGAGYWKLPYEFIECEFYTRAVEHVVLIAFHEAVGGLHRWASSPAAAVTPTIATVAQYDHFIDVLRRELQALVKAWRREFGRTPLARAEFESNTQSLHAKLPKYAASTKDHALVAHAAQYWRKQARIEALEVDGERVESPEGITASLTTVFDEIYDGSDMPSMETTTAFLAGIDLPKLPPAKVLALAEAITDEHIVASFARCRSKDTPGLSGLPIEFYREFSKLLAPILAMWCQAARNEGHFGQSSDVLIKVIPKGNGSLRPQGQRPIAHCSLDHRPQGSHARLDAACPPCRQRDHRPRPVWVLARPPNPATGLTNSYSAPAEISDQERYHHGGAGLQTSKLLVDGLGQGLRSPSRMFLEALMAKLGFPEYFIDLVMASLSQTRASILANGHVGEQFETHTWVRQGDPLSPSLFAVIIEPLLELLRQLKCGPQVKFPYQELPAYKARWIDQLSCSEDELALHRLSVTAYADDVTAFVTSTYELEQVYKAITRFETATRSRLNPDKSRLVRPRANGRFMSDKLPSDHPLKQVQTIMASQESFVVLGIDLGKDGRRNQWAALLAKLHKTLRGFYFTGLTSVVAAQYLSTFALSKIVYVSAVHAPTPDELKQLKRTLEVKLRAGKRECLMHMAIIMTPKEGGGLGLLNPEAMVAGRQATYWYTLVSEPGFASSTVLGSIQQRLYDRGLKQVSRRDDLFPETNPDAGPLVPLPLERLHANMLVCHWPLKHHLLETDEYAPSPFRGHYACAQQFILPSEEITAWDERDYPDVGRTRQDPELDIFYEGSAEDPACQQRLWASLTAHGYIYSRRPYFYRDRGRMCDVLDFPAAVQAMLVDPDWTNAFCTRAPVDLSFTRCPHGPLAEGEESEGTTAAPKSGTVTAASFRQAQLLFNPPRLERGEDGTLVGHNFCIPLGFPLDDPAPLGEIELFLSNFWSYLRPLMFKHPAIMQTWRRALDRPLLFAGRYGTPFLVASSAKHHTTSCPLCLDSEDCALHFLFECRFVRQLWSACVPGEVAQPASGQALFTTLRALESPLASAAWHKRMGSFYHAALLINHQHRWHEAPIGLLEPRHISFAQA